MKFTINPTIISPVPDQFAAGGWTLTDSGSGGSLTVTLTTMPAANGGPITDVEYQLDGGSWVSTGASSTSPVFFITGLTNTQSYSVAIRAVNSSGSGAASATKNATPTAASYSATISIRDRSELQITPEAIFFEVALTGFDSTGPGGGEVYDDRMHEVYYSWDFYATGSAGGDQSYTYQNLAKTPSQYRNSRYAYGPFASHTYRTPGTYRVSCTVTELASGKTATDTLDVVIADPSTVFTADNQTIVMDTTGTGLAAYPNATVVTSLASARSTILGFSSQSTPRRVILRRGQTFNSDGSSMGISGGSTWPSTHWVAADEAGADPIIAFSAGGFSWNHTNTKTIEKDWVFQNIDVRGGWNAVEETGNGADGHTGFTLSSKPPMQFLIDGGAIRDFGDKSLNTTITNNVSHPYRIYMNDCHQDGWRYFGMYLAGAVAVSLTGSKLEQDPLANAGGTKTGDIFNNHGPFRGSNFDSLTKMVVHSCEFHTRNDWLESGGIFGQQPCFRYDTAGIGSSALAIHGSVFEGGNNVMSFGVESGASNRRINAVVANNYILASHSTRICVLLNKAGMTLRNNIITIPNTSQYSGYDAHTFVKAQWDGEISGEGGEPIRCYNNTLINLTSSACTEFQTDGTFTDAIASNNVVYEPNLSTPNTSDGPLVSTYLFTPSELGYKHSALHGTGKTTLQTAYATPSSSVWTGTLDTGAGALGGATTGVIAWDSYYSPGVARPATKDRGATQVST